jgi:Tfp pilus assembly protein PilO
VEIKNRQKLLLIVAGIGLLLLVADSVIVSPLIGSWKARSERIETLRDKIKKGSALVAREAVVHGRWENMRTNTLPVNVSQAEDELLKAVNRWAQQSDIKLASIKPQWRESGEDYLTLECRADASGSMRSVASFLYQMEKDPLGVKVEDVEIASRDERGRQLTLGLQISGLVLTSQEK